MPKVKNIYKDKKEPDDVYIGRGSVWGNPFKIGEDGSREDVIEKYKTFFFANPELVENVESLRGKSLVCFCSPKACHGDFLLKQANQ